MLCCYLDRRISAASLGLRFFRPSSQLAVGLRARRGLAVEVVPLPDLGKATSSPTLIHLMKVNEAARGRFRLSEFSPILS